MITFEEFLKVRSYVNDILIIEGQPYLAQMVQRYVKSLRKGTHVTYYFEGINFKVEYKSSTGQFFEGVVTFYKAHNYNSKTNIVNTRQAKECIPRNVFNVELEK